jgi:hypothetical protein
MPRVPPPGWRLERMHLERIARLASLTLQERFITHATADNHYVVELLLDEAHGVADDLLSNRGYAESLSESGRQALRAFDDVFQREVGQVNLSGSDLVHQDPAWAAIREAARHCLDGVGFDLAQFEASELA